VIAAGVTLARTLAQSRAVATERVGS